MWSLAATAAFGIPSVYALNLIFLTLNFTVADRHVPFVSDSQRVASSPASLSMDQEHIRGLSSSQS